MADITPIQDTKAKELTDKERVLSLFRFIKELNKLKHKSVLNINDRDYSWAYPLSDLPNNPDYITVRYRDCVETEDTVRTPILLSVQKPTFKKCPQPDPIFADWLDLGWDDYKIAKATVKESLSMPENGDDDTPELFDDNQERVEAYENWLKNRDVWVEDQLINKKTSELFTKLYSLYFELQKDSETKELIVANGMLADRDDRQIRHPLLTRRVKLSFDADKNVVSIEDTEAPSELYTVLFQSMQGINQSAISHADALLQENDYHPLDRNETPGFLKTLAHELSSDSIFSEEKAPDKWYSKGRLFLSMEPYYIVRKRLDGTVKAIEKIIENVQETDYIPDPIIDIVKGGLRDIPDELKEETVEEQLAAVGGESVDILLSKEANREQLEIAKRIENYNAVLVQGPPGTGKTHTIANLMGHFLAQGKSVLVTCYTTKALRVLKDKVAPGLQDLCVSLLDDSNEEMERSVSGIADKMSSTTPGALKKEMDSLAVERRKVINALAQVRRDMFAVINEECERIVFNGESISPSAAADFVSKHAEDLSYIPGDVLLYSSLPLTIEQLSDLYRSNEAVSGADEEELGFDIPNPNEILTPADFSSMLDDCAKAEKKLKEAAEALKWQIENDYASKKVQFNSSTVRFTMPYPNKAELQRLKEYISSFGQIEKWMQYAAVDGRNGGSYRQRWVMLTDQIKQTCELTELTTGEQFGRKLDINTDDLSWLAGVFEKIRAVFIDKGKINRMTLMLHKDFESALNQATIDGRPVKSAGECDLVLHEIELRNNRAKCALYWDELMRPHGVPAFSALTGDCPEQVALNWVPVINRYLDWYQTDYQPLISLLSQNRLPADIVFNKSASDTELAAIAKTFDAVENVIPHLCDIGFTVLDLGEMTDRICRTKQILTGGQRSKSKICYHVLEAVNSGDTGGYGEAFVELQHMYDKYSLLRKRNELLFALRAVAPQWANDIRDRKGIHGSSEMPATISDAWKWKQLNGIILRITERPFEELQAESRRLSKEYRRITAKYAEKSGWYHLLQRTGKNITMHQALMGWKQTIRSIGKGTGKSAPIFKAEARKLMAKCQSAVPAWIMPINRALDSLDPKTNRFDVVIIDEASQSDISSMAILYMGKKLIIVGDDQQVSPMAVGTDENKMTGLKDMYITGKIPNAHLYTAKDSIYNVAETTFQSLMLKEHFRCVPEIIGFSNMLSYDYKIKPLRDASDSILLPAVVNYRVENGFREGKRNEAEAKAIVALMRACISQPEYAGKSFGVISLLGDEQAALIEKRIIDEISPKEINDRKILCGNSANFQGDERDVVFLSMVDSGDDNGPQTLREYGSDEAYRKRYNVAASRARDQLWVVHSLDAANDLKPGDIRKRLLDYSRDPRAFALKHNEIEEKAESPFEKEVAQALSDKGYNLVQQWPVGAYRLDLVAVCGQKTVAIECDGDRWHSGEKKIREDMERQTILERLGWRFIRIRGSEYYRNKDGTISRVVKELQGYDIYPEDPVVPAASNRSTELLSRIKDYAARILLEQEAGPLEPLEETIAHALNEKEELPQAVTGEKAEKPKLRESHQPTAATEGGKSAEPKPLKVPKPPKEPKPSTNIRSQWPLKPKDTGKGNKKKGKDGPRVITLDRIVGNKEGEENKREGKELIWPAVKEEAVENGGNDNPPTQSTVKQPAAPALAPKGPAKLKQPARSPVDGPTVLIPEGEFDLIRFLEINSVNYIDKRAKKGALWLVGGRELDPIVKECSSRKYYFVFKPKGGNATEKQPGWYLQARRLKTDK